MPHFNDIILLCKNGCKTGDADDDDDAISSDDLNPEYSDYYIFC